MTNNTMTSAEYIRDVIPKENRKFDEIRSRLRDSICYVALRERVESAVNAAAFLDISKKQMISGKTKQPETWNPRYSIASMSVFLKQIEDEVLLRLLHAQIGKMTEAGEALKQLAECIFEGKDLDTTNLLEEVGDGFFYDGINCVVLGTTFERVMRMNGEKLGVRYPEGFTEDAHDNRDLVAERTVLEGPIKVGLPDDLSPDSFAEPAPFITPTVADVVQPPPVAHDEPDLMIPILTPEGPVCVNPGLHRFIIYMRATCRDTSPLNVQCVEKYKAMYNTRAVGFRQMFDDIAAGRLSTCS